MAWRAPGQQRQVGAGVADVVEMAEAGLKAAEFAVTGQVGDAVGSKNTVEDAKMARDALRDAPLSPRGEID